MVPAAGMSRRMGRPKALLPFGPAPMVARVVESLASADCVSPIVVVTGHERERVVAVLAAHDVVHVFNAQYETGEMLSSIQAGVRAVGSRAGAVVLALADQPGVEAATVRSLVGAWRETGAAIVSPLYAGRTGHPVLISSLLFDEILQLGAGESLKTLMLRHADEIVKLDVTDPAVVVDVDTPTDYQEALRRWDRRSWRDAAASV